MLAIHMLLWVLSEVDNIILTFGCRCLE